MIVRCYVRYIYGWWRVICHFRPFFIFFMSVVVGKINFLENLKNLCRDNKLAASYQTSTLLDVLLGSNPWWNKTVVFWVTLGHFLYHFILIAGEKIEIFENKKYALENVIQNFVPIFNIIRCFVGYMWLVMCNILFWVIFWRFYKRLGN